MAKRKTSAKKRTQAKKRTPRKVDSLPELEVIPGSLRGSGDDSFEDGKFTKSDLNLIRTAAHHGWPIPEALRLKAIDNVQHILEHSLDEKHVLASAKTLVAMDSVNSRREANLVSLNRALTPEHHQHVHVESVNRGRNILASLLQKVNARREGGAKKGNGSTRSVAGNGDSGGNGNGSDT